MVVGVDTYSYHRLLGERRRGESARPPLPGGMAAVAEHVRGLGCDVICLQTCFLAGPPAATPGGIAEMVAPLTPVIAWGHPEGLGLGTAPPRAFEDLRHWIDCAAELTGGLLRVVAGGPRLRGARPFAEQLKATAPLLRAAADQAAGHGLVVAVENHGDLTSEQLATLVEAAGAENLGVCFDTANALRVGEDVVAAARTLAHLVRMVHVKDIEPVERAENPVAGPASVPFGSGVVPLARVLDAVAGQVDAGAPVCVEVGQVRPGDDELELIADGVAWLRRFASTPPPSRS